MEASNSSRRKFLKHGALGAGGAVLSAAAARGFFNMSKKEGAQTAVSPHTREAAWYETVEEQAYCRLCPHECLLGGGQRGICRVREARGGKLYTLVYGNPCALHIDPMEKKPLYHFLPGTPILSIATAGCNLRCLNCQNWEISQSKPEDVRVTDLPPEKLAEMSLQKKVKAIAYTYSEPVVFYEYMRDSAALAKEQGLRNVMVTAGFINEKPLREVCRFMDAANVDLKGFNNRFYKKVTGARVEPVMKALEIMKEEGVWLEITRLIVPAYSDDLKDIDEMCAWIVKTLGPDVPLHFSRFHPAYKLTRLPATPIAILDRAHETAKAAGLHHVFVGNAPGHGANDTFCPACGKKAVDRHGYQTQTLFGPDGRCSCGEPIAGVWS